MIMEQGMMCDPTGIPRSAMGDSGEGGEVTDALKYLDELDKYYSQVARPRLVP